MLKENLEILPTVFITSQVELKETTVKELEVEVLRPDVKNVSAAGFVNNSWSYHDNQPLRAPQQSGVMTVRCVFSVLLEVRQGI